MAWTKQVIKNKLATDNRWLEHGILALYDRQTYEEQRKEKALEFNKIGFNSPDSHYLSYVAKYIKNGNHLSGWHVERARKLTLKYSGQLTKIANKTL